MHLVLHRVNQAMGGKGRMAGIIYAKPTNVLVRVQNFNFKFVQLYQEFNNIPWHHAFNGRLYISTL